MFYHYRYIYFYPIYCKIITHFLYIYIFTFITTTIERMRYKRTAYLESSVGRERVLGGGVEGQGRLTTLTPTKSS